MIPFPEKKYSVIYADPPWNYAAGGKTRNVERHYRTMKPEDIYSLPVQDIAEDDCLLFLWATFPNLDVALETIRRWGFQYKTAAFVWVKRNRKSPSWFWGLGNWTRANAEICLLATKGKPKRASASVHSIIDAPISRHSELSEALEEERNGNPDVWFACNESDNFICTPQDETECLMYGKESLCKYRSRKPEGVAVELADAVIRIADLCGHLGIDLEEVIEIKMAYNEGRPYKHGKKF